VSEMPKEKLEELLNSAIDTITRLQLENERLAEALGQINGMPLYVEPVPENYISSLVKRYNKALSIADEALNARGV